MKKLKLKGKNKGFLNPKVTKEELAHYKKMFPLKKFSTYIQGNWEDYETCT